MSTETIIFREQLRLDLGDLLNAPNDQGLDRLSAYTIGYVLRTVPPKAKTLSPGERKRRIDLELKFCRELNTLFRDLFTEVVDNCPSVGIDYLGFRPVSLDTLPANGLTIKLEMTMRPQTTIRLSSLDERGKVEIVQTAFHQAQVEVCSIYETLKMALRKQNRLGEVHPINILAPGEELDQVEDRVDASSKSIANFVEKALRNGEKLKSLKLTIGGKRLKLRPMKKIIRAMAEDPCAERTPRHAHDTYVWTAYLDPNGNVYMTVDGSSVGRRSRTVPLQLLNECFCSHWRNDAGRVNINGLHQYQGKIVDLEYARSKNRFTRPHLASKHELVVGIENHRKLREVSGLNRAVPNGSLDRLVRERDALI